LPAALNSVLNQSFTDFEVLALDDASTDGSAACLDEVRDPRVRVFHLPKAGYTAHLNYGLAHARAEIIARMDADDISLPSRFASQFAYLHDHPGCVLCGCQMKGIGPQGEWRESWDWECAVDDGQIRYQLLVGSPFLHPGVMYRKAAVAAAGGYRPEFEPAEDYDLWCRLSQFGVLANLPECLMNYRLHAASVSSARHETQLAKMKEISRRHVVSSGFAASIEEFDGFYRCAGPRTGAPRVSVDDASLYARVVGRFLDSLAQGRCSPATLPQLRRSVRWKLQAMSRSFGRFESDRLRLLRLGARMDCSLTGIASIVKSGLLGGGGLPGRKPTSPGARGEAAC
jgi:hypothetical protein